MDRQCSSCGGFCKKSGCERENVKSEPKETAPPQREWQGLTDEEKRIAYVMYEVMGAVGYTHAIEEKLKEKNT